MLAGIEFAHGWVLVGLALLPFYAAWRFGARRREAVAYPPLQYRGETRRGLAALELPVELLAVAVLLFGLAGPHRVATVDMIEDEGIDVVLVLDVSLSMLARDFEPDRLAALRDIASDFVRRAGSHRVGLVIFAGDPFIQAPLTSDHLVLRHLLEGVTVRVIDQNLSGGTAIGDALLVAADHLRSWRVEGRDQALVLITDGESNMGSDPLLGARFVADLGIRLYAIGIGGLEPIEVFVDGERLGGDDPYLAVLDEAELRRIAAATDGLFYRAIDGDSLEAIFGELSRLESAPLEVREVTVRQPLGRVAAALALPLLAAYLVLGGVYLRRPLR